MKHILRPDTAPVQAPHAKPAMQNQEEAYNRAQQQEKGGAAARAATAKRHVLPQIGSIEDDKKLGNM